jgi:hypothetical protein
MSAVRNVDNAVTIRAVRTGKLSANTLAAAHETLHRYWPGGHRPLSTLLAYHEAAAALYGKVAEIDSAHHHEALFWVQQERETAQALADQIAAAAHASGSGSP